MTLPKIHRPTFSIHIPSLNREVVFSPFIVRDEKILLMALESYRQDENDQILVEAYKQVIRNCVQEDIDVDKLATFDLEYIFIKLRAQSVNNIVELAYRDGEDDKVYKFEVDLNTIELKKDDRNDPIIHVTDDITMKLKFPTLAVTKEMAGAKTETEMFDVMLLNCVDTIYDKETVYEDYTHDELLEFLETLDTQTFEKIRLFFDTMPCVRHVIKYTNSEGTEREIILSSLSDFFVY